MTVDLDGFQDAAFMNAGNHHYPMEVPLDDGSMVKLLEAVRFLPGRRVMCRAEWGGQAVYAKIFFGKQAERDERRDAAGVIALTHAGIPTPRLLFRGMLASQRARVLLFPEIPDSQSAEVLLADTDSSEMRAQFAQRLASCVATHHRHGLIQCDMYLKNFLVSGAMLYTLDGDGVRKLPKLFRHRAAMNNLAQMLSKFDVEDDHWITQAYAAYCKALEKDFEQAELRSLSASVARHRKRAVRRYADSKVFRNCSDIIVERTSRRFVAVARSAARPQLLERLQKASTWFESHPVQLLKRGHTCTVALERLDGRDVVIKRYNIKNKLHAIARAWRPSRAAHSWAAAHRLLMYGIATPAPLALYEERWGPLRRGAYYVAEAVRAPDALQYFSDPAVSDADKVIAAERTSALLAKLQHLGLVHGDLKANNVLMLLGQRPMLIDLDALYEPLFTCTAQRGHQRDLRRWMRNWQSDPVVKRLMQDALIKIYRNDPVLLKAGIVSRTSEMK